MASIMLWGEDLRQFYFRMDSISDLRLVEWPFVSSMTFPLLAILSYLLFVCLGPKFMRDREPFQLSRLLVLYNGALTVLNLYIFIEILLSTRDANYSFSCQKVSYAPRDPKEMRVAAVIWWFYLSKIIELLDTVFFILRKKSNQVSFLHVYHHSSMVCLWWIGIKWVAGGQSFVAVMINSFIHVIMYAYYGMSVIPSLRKYLWWKRHLTQMQLIQFCILMAHGIVSLRVKCDYPLWMQYGLIVYMISFLVLFGNFYLHSYVVRRRKQRAEKEQQANGVVAHDNAHVLPEAEEERKKRV